MEAAAERKLSNDLRRHAQLAVGWRWLGAPEIERSGKEYPALPFNILSAVGCGHEGPVKLRPDGAR